MRRAGFTLIELVVVLTITAIGLTFARQMTDKVSWGIQGKMIREDLMLTSTTSYELDMGISAYTGYKSLRLAILIVLDTAAIWFLSRLVMLGYYPLAAAVLLILILVNVVFLRQAAYPIRWMVVGLVLMGLFTIYPILFTIWVSLRSLPQATGSYAVRQRPLRDSRAAVPHVLIPAAPGPRAPPPAATSRYAAPRPHRV